MVDKRTSIIIMKPSGRTRELREHGRLALRRGDTEKTPGVQKGGKGRNNAIIGSRKFLWGFFFKINSQKTVGLFFSPLEVSMVFVVVVVVNFLFGLLVLRAKRLKITITNSG